MEQTPTGRLHTLRSGADFLSLQPDTLRKWIRKGKLRCVRVALGKQIRIHESDLLALIEDRKD